PGARPPRCGGRPLRAPAPPPVRAAALRVLIGQGGATTDRALRKAGGDRAAAVRQVRQQLIFPVVHDRTAPKPPPLPYPPEDPAARKAAVAKMVEELPGLERQSAWEEMVRRAETLAAWSRAGHDEATDALIELTGTKLQQFWAPGVVQKNPATRGRGPPPRA